MYQWTFYPVLLSTRMYNDDRMKCDYIVLEDQKKAEKAIRIK
jgi:hypothetical protein